MANFQCLSRNFLGYFVNAMLGLAITVGVQMNAFLSHQQKITPTLFMLVGNNLSVFRIFVLLHVGVSHRPMYSSRHLWLKW